MAKFDQNRKIVRSDTEWRQLLTEEQYQIARQRGTERACTGLGWDESRSGHYECVCCETELFDFAEKFESGTGWPSFSRPLVAEAIVEKIDKSHGMTRLEALCSTCGAHLGHLFPDGPPPTGLRYCINATILRFVPKNV